ncbi:Metacaspase-1 [Seminavis robusta]|uniref:Metacaspase-1 n=1 Tax=Seminavis robusta TaxID=568900 RepID=A0A9N8EK24_9STRA|nr:Metacaspase-1 [Seminavis robusta]|eukprot:Sro1383_g267990.1 Metacaspase-1 (722) ;mRNA; r:12538-14893
MGNSASKAEDDDASLFGKENSGHKLGLNESLASGSKGASYENDSLTCPDSKSTLGTEFTGLPKQPPPNSHRTSSSGNKNNKDHSNMNAASNKVSSTSKTPRANHRGGGGGDDPHNSSLITDDQVHVNLAMADLMAYLQVVANNSNNLPLSRRDDPELGRTVSNLTSDEYARKSAAFIPSDVRVISGAFTRYGRVWDLPTSEEFNACDGAQEPGRSYGGACCNSMLKVLYDSANDAADAAQTKEASDALFDDDEDEESILGKSVKSMHSLEFAPSNPATISWAALMRRMKAEISDIEHAQHPTLTTTRKFDLNQPFSIVPENFDAKVGKKRSLLIGCNYTNIHGAELKASHDDIGSMKDYIVNVHGFPEAESLMTILLDDDTHKHPTHLNITEAFKALSEQSQPGDAVFIQFSGHGGRVLDSPIDSEAESYDEVIVPSDYSVSGLIRDTLIFKTLLAPMKYGVTVTILIDCCDTGMVLDLPYRWNTKNDRHDQLAKLSLNDDFSFVRFLKVVRTLYESSTFTQLGKTVGSVLNHNPNAPQPSSKNDQFASAHDEANHEATSGIPHHEPAAMKEQDALAASASKSTHGSLLASLVSCTSPETPDDKETTKKQRGSRKDKKKGGGGESDAIVPFGGEDQNDKAPTTQSLLEQMMGSRTPLVEQLINCTLAHAEDDYSDDETYNTRTVDGGSYSLDGSSTFDTMTDDGSRSAPQARRQKRRSRRR